LSGIKLTHGFGVTLARLLRNGVGIHHAGMLPRYRRLVERLAGEGLLPVICGTDTLGVGVNIPIRTVVMTALTKYDGTKTRVFSAREFHQLAGRAGRPGFDPDGHIWVQAPDHVIENAKALSRAGDDPKARRKAIRAKAPERFVHYDEATMDRLISAIPEPLVSRFHVTPDLVATVLARPDGPRDLKHLLATNHDSPTRQRQHRRRAIAIYRSLEAAGVAERIRDANGRCISVRIGSVLEGTEDREMLRLSSPLTAFGIEVVATLDREDPQYVLDVVSVIESTLEDPRQILMAQRDAARAAAIAQMKAEGVQYEERIERIEKVTWPMPLAELIDSCFETYRAHHPWVFTAPSPKSVLREMLESGDTFSTIVRRYRLERSEGLMLRYLTDAWRALDRGLPEEAFTPGLEDVIDWLTAMIRATDASLLDEWTRLSGGEVLDREAPEALDALAVVPAGPPASWKTTVRTAAFGWVELLAAMNHETLSQRCGWTVESLIAAIGPYWQSYDRIEIDADARSGQWFHLEEQPTRWVITQRLSDPLGDHDWCITAEVDLAAAIEEGAPLLQMVGLGPLSANL